MDSVSTLNPGDSATVSTGFDGSNVHFTFGIPREADGTNGTVIMPLTPFSENGG